MTTENDKLCGDYPAPCNCDNSDTHDGAVPVESPGLTLTYQWGYALENDLTRVILPDGHGTRWFSTPEEAGRQKRNDLRWRFPTVLVKRLVGPVEIA